MRKSSNHVFKHLRPHASMILAIVALLLVQAFGELTLPTYTANIVNVGIQQGGIENAVPEAMREDTLQKLLLLLHQEEGALVARSYTQGGGERRSLAPVSEDVFIRLDAIMQTRLPIIAALEGNGELAQLFFAQIPPGTDAFDVLSQMPEPARLALIGNIDAAMENLPQSTLRQSAIAYIRSEYDALGVDAGARQMRYLFTTGARMLGLVLVAVLASVAVSFLSSRVAAGFSMRLRASLFEKVIGFGAAESNAFSTASLITRSTNDIQQIQTMLTMALRVLIYAPILAAGGIFRALATNTSMAWTIALGVGGVLAVIVVLVVVAMPRFKKLQLLLDKLNLVSREVLSGIPVIRAFCTQAHEADRIERANRNLMRTNLFVTRTMALAMPMIMLIMNALSVLILYSGAHSVDLGQMQVGDLMAFIQYAMQIVMSFLMLSMMSIVLPRAGVSIGRINEVLNTDPAIKDPPSPVAMAADKRASVRFENVSFRYPGAEADVLSNISFEAERGRVTAIVGGTGSGKSTLVNLIPRFYDVSAGAVYVGGADVRHLCQATLRAYIGYVPQQGTLFSGTIADNLRFGREDATEEELRLGAWIAQAAFIFERPQGLDAPIAQGGTNVSGGQKQRLAIARAVVKKPDIYIFDDSFSALDTKTDAALRRALRPHTADSAVIIVAQRVNTILHADRIVVLDDGRVAGIGTHRELLASCSVYEQIARSQLSPEEIERSAAPQKEGEQYGE